MRHGLVGVGFCALVLGFAAPAPAQFLSVDARRVGMAGLTLHRGGNLTRYNAAYRAVPEREGTEGAKFTIPLPLGLIQYFNDEPEFDSDSAAFNPVEIANLVLNPPLFYEVKKVPTPTNDVEFTIGKNELIIDLGRTQALIPSDEFGIGGSSRLLDPGLGFKGFRVSVMGWLHHQVGFQLGDSLRDFLKEAAPAQPNTRYNVLADVIGQAGFAPTVGYVGRVAGSEERGLYLGAAVRYYLGLVYGASDSADAGFTTQDTIFGSGDPVTPDLDAVVRYSKLGNSLGRGFGGDIGLVWVSGPIEIGVGVNDIGATLTWSDTRVEREVYDTATDQIVTMAIANHVETETELPVSYIANVVFSPGTGTTLGADIVDNGRGTQIHVGGEHRVGLLALRGGVARDQRKKMQFGWGGGLRFGPVSLDVGFWTHSNAFSDERGITMATSLSVY